MDNNYQEILKKAENYIHEEKYYDALNALKDLAVNHPDDGIIPYYLAIIAMNNNDNLMALEYFDTAQKKGFESADLYYQKIRILNDIGETEKAETLFEHALEIAQTDDETWALLEQQANFYLSNDLILNADRVAKTLIQKYPNDYIGYHYHFLARLAKEAYEDAEMCLNIVPEELQNHSMYLTDIAELYRVQDEERFYALLKTDSRYKEYNPVYYYKNIYRQAHSEGNTELMLDSLKKLAFEFGDQDSFLSMILLLHSAQMFKESAEVANIVIEANKEDANIYFFYAMLYQMFNYYHIQKDSLTEETVKWILDTGKWCVDYANSTGIEEIIDSTISSVNFLFEQIEKSSHE